MLVQYHTVLITSKMFPHKWMHTIWWFLFIRPTYMELINVRLGVLERPLEITILQQVFTGLVPFLLPNQLHPKQWKHSNYELTYSVVICSINVPLRLVVWSTAGWHSVCMYSRQWTQPSVVRVVWIRRHQSISGIAPVCSPRRGYVWWSQLPRPGNISTAVCPTRLVQVSVLMDLEHKS